MGRSASARRAARPGRSVLPSPGPVTRGPRLAPRSVSARGPFRVGVTSGLRPLPSWKKEADFLFAQVSFSIDKLLEWRSSLDFAGPIYAGVMVVVSAAMARKLSTDVPELVVPEQVIGVIERDPSAGVDIACDLVAEVRESGAFD